LNSFTAFFWGNEKKGDSLFMKKRFLVISVMSIFIIIPAFTSNALEFRYEGIQFSYNGTLATNVTGENVPAEPRTHGLPALETGSPDHIRISFDHSATPGIFDPHDAQLLIFPVNDYQMIFEVVTDTIEMLRTLLTEKPVSIEGELPFLPPMKSNQRFSVQMKYLDFQNGTGIRYLTSYDQGGAESPQKTSVYTYQGLTTDGKYYVSFVFPISVSGLSEARNPTLTLLDALIESLVVKPENLG
jgi:hypothetical protein